MFYVIPVAFVLLAAIVIALIHFWLWALLGMAAMAAACSMVWLAMTIRENLAYGWPWWTR